MCVQAHSDKIQKTATNSINVHKMMAAMTCQSPNLLAHQTHRTAKKNVNVLNQIVVPATVHDH